MESRKLAEHIRELAAGKKGENIVILDMRDATDLTDYFVVVSANSGPQLKAISNEIVGRLKTEGLSALGADAPPSSSWNALDYFDVVVHLMTPEARKFYDLEGLWKDASRVEPNAAPAEPRPIGSPSSKARSLT